MSDIKAKIYTPTGQYVGYLLNPTIEQFPENEYEISGRFFEENGEVSHKLEFNPESVPYSIDLSDVQNLKHSRLINVYVQRGRQPVRMTGVGAAK
jgi:hypothetical protein